MIMVTIIRLLNAFPTCPSCNNQLKSDSFKINENKAEIHCACGWSLKLNEHINTINSEQ